MPTKLKFPEIQHDLPTLCHAITEHAPLPMVTVEGATHKIRYANPAFCQLVNKPSEELVGKRLSELLAERDKCVTLLDRVFRTKKPESFTERESSKSHPVFWSYTAWPVREVEGLVGIMIQVTETAEVHGKTVAMNEALMLGSLRQHELTEAANWANTLLQAEIKERQLADEALQRAQTLLKDRAGQLEGLVAERTAELTGTNKQLETLVYSIAHDLRQPLRAMQGFSAMLVEEGGADLDETCSGYANRINKAAQFMDALLNDLLTFSAVAQQRVELTSVNLNNALELALSRLQKEIKETRARVETVGPWPAVLGHAATLERVFFDLLGNSLRFMAPGVKPRIRIWTEAVEGPAPRTVERGALSVERQNGHLAPRPTPQVPAAPTIRIWVEDNGIGIAPEHQDQIFRLFLRLHGETYGGTGMGLAIVQKGIERMGGRIGVDSAAGKGSRFWFELKKA
jgi:PAS domain S-box-containing protein